MSWVKKVLFFTATVAHSHDGQLALVARRNKTFQRIPVRGIQPGPEVQHIPIHTLPASPKVLTLALAKHVRKQVWLDIALEGKQRVDHPGGARNLGHAVLLLCYAVVVVVMVVVVVVAMKVNAMGLYINETFRPFVCATLRLNYVCTLPKS